MPGLDPGIDRAARVGGDRRIERPKCRELPVVNQLNEMVRRRVREGRTAGQQLATQLSGVQSVLDGLLVDRPRRNILRRARS